MTQRADHDAVCSLPGMPDEDGYHEYDEQVQEVGAVAVRRECAWRRPNQAGPGSSPSFPVPSLPDWSWDAGVFARGDATIVWQNGWYRWTIRRKGKVRGAGARATLASAVAAVNYWELANGAA